MIHRFVFLIILTLLVAGCGQNDSAPFGLLGSANATSIPSFLQVGKTYFLNSGHYKVLEIDKTSEWIKVIDIEGPKREAWLNLNQVNAIFEETP